MNQAPKHQFSLGVELQTTLCTYLDADGIEKDGVHAIATFKGGALFERIYDLDGEDVPDALAVNPGDWRS